MKIKNVKVGVRVVVVTNHIKGCGVVSGDTGTIVEAGSANPWVHWDAHTNASDDKRWSVDAESLRVLKPKHFPVGTKVVLVQDALGNNAGTYGEVVVSDGTDVPKVKLADGIDWWISIEYLGLRNE